MIQICLLSFISDFGIRISNFFNEEGLLDLMSMSRARVRHIFSAKGAAFTSSLGRRPRIRGIRNFAEQLDHHSLHAPVAQ